jgi:predicted ribosome quality control (RQC) complex YloA/Tae2 family protein
MKIIEFNVDEREFVIKIGTNAQENWFLIDNSKADDLWFHVNEHPSGHVVVEEKTEKKKLKKSNKTFGYPHELILECAKYCKNQSKLKKNNCKIIYTTINNIRKGSVVGSVITKNVKILSM